MFDTDTLTTRPVGPGMLAIQGEYAVRSMVDYFKPTGLYMPRDWSTNSDQDRTGEDPAPNSTNPG
jgi:hypothetical protein